MYKRDVAVVILSFFALFLCLQHEGSFSFRKAWCVARRSVGFVLGGWLVPAVATNPGSLCFTCTCLPYAHRYHATLHESHKLDMLQDRLEDLPPPVVVRSRGATQSHAESACDAV